MQLVMRVLYAVSVYKDRGIVKCIASGARLIPGRSDNKRRIMLAQKIEQRTVQSQRACSWRTTWPEPVQLMQTLVSGSRVGVDQSLIMTLLRG